ncbi:MAG: hypothetical protein K2P19_11185 [Kineothrix sp.]|nr:hypothetical protein [Kineothrix sp.]NBI92088.1 hypothetical protein [Lachnospiraceae bacterium]
MKGKDAERAGWRCSFALGYTVNNCITVINRMERYRSLYPRAVETVLALQAHACSGVIDLA